MEYLIFLIVIVTIVAIAFFKGESSGEAKTDKKVLGNVKKAKEIADAVEIIPVDVKRDRLRNDK